MGSSVARLAGASTRRSQFMVPRFSMADTTAMATVITSVNSMNPMDMASNRVEDFTVLLVLMAAVASMTVAEGSMVAAEAADTKFRTPDMGCR
jgi:hypothetical protein